MATDTQEPNNGSKKRYGKRPLWQWILLYVIIAGIVYFAIYYFYLRNNSSLYNNGSKQTNSSSNVPDVNNSFLATKTDSKLGKYLTEPNGKPLYIYGGDSNGVSNCTGSCLASWPAYMDSGATTSLPSGMGTITRTDNEQIQFTYNGMPLYTFVSDSGTQVTGNGVANFTVAKPVADPTPTAAPKATNNPTNEGSSNY